jgi:hypothetical protein
MRRAEDIAAVSPGERLPFTAFVAFITRDHGYGLRSLIHAFAQSPLFLSMKVDNP